MTDRKADYLPVTERGCAVCGLTREADERGECNVPMPTPQPPDCLAEQEERANA